MEAKTAMIDIPYRYCIWKLFKPQGQDLERLSQTAKKRERRSIFTSHTSMRKRQGGQEEKDWLLNSTHNVAQHKISSHNVDYSLFTLGGTANNLPGNLNQGHRIERR